MFDEDKSIILMKGVSRDMVSITTFNNKGGVGKTTFLCNLASFIKKSLNKKVLVIDADPQCNATVYLLKSDTVLKIYSKREALTVDSFFDSLRKGKGYLKGSVSPIRSPRFEVDLVPGDPKLALSEDLLASDWKSGSSGGILEVSRQLLFSEI